MTGEISRLQTLLQSSNLADSRTPTKIVTPSSEIYAQLRLKIAELIVHKAKINAANIGVYDRIETLAQMKSLLSQVSSLRTDEIFNQRVHPHDKDNLEVYSVTAHIDAKTKEALRAELQLNIEALQDEIDEYNATTQI